MAEQQDPSQKRPPVPGQMQRAIGTGLISSGFASIGSALSNGDPNVSEAARGMGAGITNAFRQRWYKSEFDTFQAEHVTPYLNSKNEVMKNYKTSKRNLDDGIAPRIGPDGRPEIIDLTSEAGRERAIRYRGEIEEEAWASLESLGLQLSNSAHKYISNPFIDQQIGSMYAAASESLGKSINPQQTLDSEGAIGDIAYKRKVADANLLNAQSNAAGAKEKKITNPEEAWNALGPQGVPGWMLSDPNGMKILDSETGEAYKREARADLEAQLRKKNPLITPEEMEVKVNENSVRLKQLALGKLLTATLGEDKAASIGLYHPSLFSDPTSTEREVGVKTRLDPAVTESKVKEWEELALNQLHAELAKAEDPPELNEAIDAIVSKWLPAALNGDIEDPNLDHLTATNSKATAEYRASVVEAVRPYLEKHWNDTGTGAAMARGLFPEESRKQTIRNHPPGKLGMRAGRKIFHKEP